MADNKKEKKSKKEGEKTKEVLPEESVGQAVRRGKEVKAAEALSESEKPRELEQEELKQEYGRLQELLQGGDYEKVLELLLEGGLRTEVRKLLDAVIKRGGMNFPALFAPAKYFEDDKWKNRPEADRLTFVGERLKENLECHAKQMGDKKDQAAPRMLWYAVCEQGLMTQIRSISERWQNKVNNELGLKDILNAAGTQEKLRLVIGERYRGAEAIGWEIHNLERQSRQIQAEIENKKREREQALRMANGWKKYLSEK